MRVTHVITRLIVGGAQENTIASVLGLQQQPEVEVRLISGCDAGPEGSLAHAFAHSPQTLSFVRELVRPLHPWKDWLAFKRLVEIFRKERPDIVHTHSGKAGVIGRLAAHKAGVPVIIHTIHGPSFGPFQGPLANTLFRSAERHAAKVTTHFVVVADAMTKQYVAAGIGSPLQYTKVYSGFPLHPFFSASNAAAVRQRFGIAPGDIVIGKIARLFKLKGHDDLFHVAAELLRQCPHIKFLLVGDGPWRERFEQQARSLGLENHFIFTGLVPPEQVPELVGIMDILVHLSLREGLPRALPQALAAGKPVVAYDCDGAGEVCLDGETGFLIRPGDLSGLSECLTRLAGDSALRVRLGSRGQEFVRDRFPVERMVQDLFSLYLKLSPAIKMPTS